MNYLKKAQGQQFGLGKAEANEEEQDNTPF